MLAFQDGTIVEDYSTRTMAQLEPVIDGSGTLAPTSGYRLGMLTSNCIGGSYVQPWTYWNSYPVYVCTDKTKKAIEVLKALQAEKLLKCDSVPRFIELVEKISNIL